MDADTISRIIEIKKDVEVMIYNYENRLQKVEAKRDALEIENKSLHNKLIAFQVLCAKNDIDFEYIIAE